jgi:sarcosine oxidase subunit delta
VARDTVSNEIVEIYPMGSLPVKTTAKTTHKKSWRRNTAAEKAATQSQSKAGGSK